MTEPDGAGRRFGAEPIGEATNRYGRLVGTAERAEQTRQNRAGANGRAYPLGLIVLFDLDGTLSESETAIVGSLSAGGSLAHVGVDGVGDHGAAGRRAARRHRPTLRQRSAGDRRAGRTRARTASKPSPSPGYGARAEHDDAGAWAVADHPSDVVRLVLGRSLR